ncbi:MAG TPA: hypothetical protein VMU01_02770 [Rhizomicrobium sp.]|nr:hypothetical protein [Rhizomicrobium sp.]
MTGRLLLSGAVAALVLCAPAFAQFAGTWDSNRGRMHLEQQGAQVRGDYERNGGHLEGDVDGRTLTGIWVQEDSERRCSEKRMDTHYWGHFRITLDENGKVFHGYRSLCDGDPASGGQWIGGRD